MKRTKEELLNEYIEGRYVFDEWFIVNMQRHCEVPNYSLKTDARGRQYFYDGCTRVSFRTFLDDLRALNECLEMGND